MGMRQRFGIAQAIMENPRILILDYVKKPLQSEKFWLQWLSNINKVCGKTLSFWNRVFGFPEMNLFKVRTEEDDSGNNQAYD